jgi:hypothetical protein
MISASTIDQIRESLQQGDQKEIANRTDFTQTFVNMVLNNKVNSESNGAVKVLTEAQNLIEERKERIGKLEDRIGQ